MKFMQKRGLQDKAVRWVVACLLMLSVAACGGGGGSAGTSSGSSVASLYFTAPSSVTVAVGAAPTYSIGGGVAPYSVSSSNMGVASASVSGTTLTINGVATGIATIALFDAAGRSVSTSVSVGSGGIAVPLYMASAGAVTIAVGATSTYTIGGGTAPYTASSANTSIAAAAIVGTTLTIRGVATGAAQVTVFDSTGAAVNTTATIGSNPAINALYMTAPSAVSLLVGTTSSYTVGGGVGPYTVSSSNTNVSTASITGAALTVTGLISGTAQISVFDSTGKSVGTSATVSTGAVTTTLYVAAPSAVNVATGATTAPYVIGGGTAPYIVSSSNTAIATASVTGTQLTISGVAAGAAQVSLFDATGAAIHISVTVGSGAAPALYITAPAAVTSNLGATATYMIGGGVAPYIVSTSNPSVASAAVTGSTLTVNGLIAGSAQISVFDATGASVSTTVTVGSSKSIALFTTAPGSVTLTVGTAPTYTVSGGAAPYSVSSSNTSVATANIIGGNTVSVAAVAPGAAQVVVFDSVGGSVPVNATVVSASASTPLYTTALSSVTVGTGASAEYTIGGGTSPYTVTSGNTSVVTATVTGSTLTIHGVAGGSASVLVRDSANATVPVTVNVGSANPLFTTAPATLTIATGAHPTYTIGGGSAPYSASSSNVGVATVGVSGTTLTITGVSAGSAQISVLDSTGSPKTISLTVDSGGVNIGLFTTAPGTITIATGASPVYAIGGGTAPYVVTSSNLSVVTTTGSSGTSLHINGLTAGNANVVVTDAAGTTRTIVVTVSPTASTPLVVAPNSTTASVGDVLRFSVSGGSPDYSVAVNNLSIATASPTSGIASGGTFDVTLQKVGSTTVAVTDSLGQTVTLTLTVDAATATLRLSPSVLSIGEDFLGNVVLNIYGGTSGATYTAFTSDLVLSSVLVGASPATITVGLGSQGNRCIGRPVLAPYSYNVTVTVVDNLGASATSVLTIVDNNSTCP